MKNKKGQIGQIETMVIALIGIGIVLVIGFLIMAETKTQAIEMADSKGPFTNASIAITADTFTVVNSSCASEGLTVAQVYNDSCGGNNDQCTLLLPGNYTVVGRTINVSDNALGGVVGIATIVSMNYTCKEITNASVGISEVQNATGQIPGWLPIIIITVIGALLIGLVSMFRDRK